MTTLIRTYEGKDLVIPRRVMEELGIRPGDSVVIRPRTVLRPKRLSASERQRRANALERLYGVWTAEDELAFREDRRRMWESWQPRNLS